MKHHFLQLGILSLCVSALLLALASPAHSQGKVAIIMPEVRAPYKVIFDDIYDGIVENLNQQSISLIINKEVKSSTVDGWIANMGISAIIALGPAAHKSVSKITTELPVVSGAMMTATPDDQDSLKVALSPEPAELFDQLSTLNDNISRVAVVYNTDRYQWLINLAQKKALSYGIDLLTYKASNVKQSAKIYDQLLADEKPQSLAIWLLQDRTIVDSKVVLPFILERSWQRSIMVFSSSLGHVKKGVLFCMYPDNRAHGKQLAQIIDNYYQLPARVHKDPMPTTDLLMAINSRTAAHLGLDLNKSDLRKIDVVFPLTN